MEPTASTAPERAVGEEAVRARGGAVTGQ